MSIGMPSLSRGLSDIYKAEGGGHIAAGDNHSVKVQAPNVEGMSKVESSFSEKSLEAQQTAKLNFTMALKGDFRLNETVLKYIETKIDIKGSAALEVGDAKKILSELVIVQQVKDGLRPRSDLAGLTHFTLAPKSKDTTVEVESHTTQMFKRFKLDQSSSPPQTTSPDTKQIGSGQDDDKHTGGTDEIVPKVVSSSQETDMDDLAIVVKQPTDKTDVEETPETSETETVQPQKTQDEKVDTERKPLVPPPLLSSYQPQSLNIDTLKEQLRQREDDKSGGPVPLGPPQSPEKKPTSLQPIDLPKTSLEGTQRMVEELKRMEAERSGEKVELPPTLSPSGRQETETVQTPPTQEQKVEGETKPLVPPPLLSSGTDISLKLDALKEQVQELKDANSKGPAPLGLPPSPEKKPTTLQPIDLPKTSLEGTQRMVEELKRMEAERSGNNE